MKGHPAWADVMVAPAPVEPTPDVDVCIAAALAAPVGTPPLHRLVRPGQRVALLVDDGTRKTPVRRILPALLAELDAAGIARDAVAIVVALGTHRPMLPAELAARLGPEVVASYRVVNLPCTADAALVYLGEAEGAIPAWVQRAAVDADVRIGVGMITPHLDAGWSGGAKIVLPGVCGLATVDAFHRASAFVDASQLGRVDAPMRQALERFVAAQAPLHFIVNVVLTLAGDLYACVAGDALAAHRAGVAHARQVYGALASRRFPIVVADCAPYDQDLWQSIKGAWAGSLLVEDGGTLVLATAAPEGISNYALVPGYAGQPPATLRQVILAGSVEDAMQAATGVMWGMLRQRMRLVFVSPGLAPDIVAAMDATWQPSVEAAVAAAKAALPASQRHAVAWLPRAGVVLPLIRTGGPK